MYLMVVLDSDRIIKFSIDSKLEPYYEVSVKPELGSVLSVHIVLTLDSDEFINYLFFFFFYNFF